jgi:hypothetical protein
MEHRHRLTIERWSRGRRLDSKTVLAALLLAVVVTGALWEIITRR